MKVSVLISVYNKEKPNYLRQSLESIFSQTMPPDEIVLVEDGPLTDDLNIVIDSYAESHKELHIVKLPHNLGLGPALNEGIKHCNNDIIARMDSDDISKSDRLEKEYTYLEQHPEICIVGSWADEFIDNFKQSESIRKVPQSHEQIVAFSKRRNPMNHPTVMFRKKAVENAGSYHDCPLFEDYDLWVRMIKQGSRFYNLQEPLLYFRLTKDFYNRRGGWKYTALEIKFQKHLHAIGHIGYSTMIGNILIRTILRILPNNWRKKSYYFFLRR